MPLLACDAKETERGRYHDKTKNVDRGSARTNKVTSRMATARKEVPDVGFRKTTSRPLAVFNLQRQTAVIDRERARQIPCLPAAATYDVSWVYPSRQTTTSDCTAREGRTNRQCDCRRGDEFRRGSTGTIRDDLSLPGIGQNDSPSR